MARRGAHPLLLIGGLAAILVVAAGLWLIMDEQEVVPTPGDSRVVRPEPPEVVAPAIELPAPASIPDRPDPVREAAEPVGGRIEGRLVDVELRPAGPGTVEVLLGEALPLAGFASGLKRTGLRGAADENGRFVIEDVPSGESLTLRASGETFATSEAGPYMVRAGESMDVGNVMVQAGIRLQGFVHDQAGRGVAGARVALTPDMVLHSKSRPLRLVLTDEQGRFVMPPVPRQPLRLLVMAEGYANVLETLALQQVESRLAEAVATMNTLATHTGPVAEVVIRLEDAARLTGRLVDREGRGLGGSEVLATPRYVGRHAPRHHGGSSAVTDADGRFVMDDLVQGDYQLRADPVGYLLTRLDIGADDFDSTEGVELVARPAGTISGRVVDHTGRPLTAFELRLRLCQGRSDILGMPMDTAQRITDAGGSFEFDDLAAGWYRLEAWARGFGLTLTDVVRVDRGRHVSGVEITLKLAARVVGRVVRDDGAPVAGARVSLHNNRTSEIEFLRSALWSKATQTSTRTGRDGTYVLDGLSAQAYQIEIDHPRSPIQRRDDVVARAGKTTEVEDFVLVRSASLSGFAMDAAGQPMPRALVQIASSNRVNRRTRADSEGAFRFDRLPPGTYSLHVGGGAGAFDKSVQATLRKLTEPDLAPSIELSPGEEGRLNVRADH